ncbi:checkpoint protein Hus1/Mec3 [Paraphysoderma sedebokerense]|nr:checkpoint protein Hus1/Mec3 [Paraphysoderma sedebokerense]
MKLRTTFKNPSFFAKVAQSVEKISKLCALKFTPEKVHFIVKDSDGGTQVWSHIEADAIFENYQIESMNRNVIWLEVSTDYLIRAFRSTQNAHEVSMKLAKKDGKAVMSLNISSESRSGKPVVITQDIPIRVLQKAQIADLKEPAIPTPEIYIMLPSLHSLRTVAERMKSLSSHIILAANMNGELVLRAETDTVNIETRYCDLVHPELDGNQEGRSQQRMRDPTEFAEVRVDVKDFIKFVHSYHVNPSNVVCCIHDELCLVFYVYVGDPNRLEDEDSLAILTYLIPAKAK